MEAVKKTICEICGREISISNYTKHIRGHNNGNFDKYNKTHYSLNHEDLFCKFCGKECKNKNSLIQHEIRCKNNPNKISVSKSFNNGNRPAWNKGLTKETDERVRVGAIHLSETFAKTGGTFKGKHHSEETIEKLRKSGGIRLGSGNGKNGYYNGIYCRSTYELVYVIYNVDHNIKFSPCKTFYEYEYNGRIHKYYPDFELEDGTIVEIKGYYTDLVKVKTEAVKDRKIIVLYKDDLKYAFDYVKENYEYKQLKDLYNTT